MQIYLDFVLQALLFAQRCDCNFGGFLIHKGVPKLQQIFEIHKDFSNKMQIYLDFVLQSLVICTKV